MNFENNADRVRKRLLIETAKLTIENRLTSDIDRLPLKLFPKNKDGIRCCVHKDRAVTKNRLQAVLGHRIEEETDELKPLRDYAEETLERETISGPMLTVVDEACSSCVKARHFVTNACRGCVARPCLINCPKDAIQITESHAKIDEEKCVDCGICRKVCPYHAIVYIPVPCEDACPADAITKDEYGREEIDYTKCVFCGKCMSACPFGAIMERSQIVDVLKHVLADDGPRVVAMLAPALAGQFPGEFEQVVAAVHQLGFDDVVEVAVGAKITAQKEAMEIEERLAEGEPFMTTSCCPAYTELVKKHVPDLKKFVSDTKTPMHYTAELVRKDDPNTITVFVGPCVAKRNEALHDPYVNYVLTVEELGALFVAANIEIADCEAVKISDAGERNGRGFPVTGGVSGAVKNYLKDDSGIETVLVDGLDKKSIKVLSAYSKGKCPGNMVEVMSCEGGCVAGPCGIGKTAVVARRLKAFIAKNEAEDPQEKKAVSTTVNG